MKNLFVKCNVIDINLSDYTATFNFDRKPCYQYMEKRMAERLKVEKLPFFTVARVPYDWYSIQIFASADVKDEIRSRLEKDRQLILYDTILDFTVCQEDGKFNLALSMIFFADNYSSLSTFDIHHANGLPITKFESPFIEADLILIDDVYVEPARR